MTKTHEELLREAVEKALTGFGLSEMQCFAVNAVVNAIRPIIAQTANAVPDELAAKAMANADGMCAKYWQSYLPYIQALKSAGYRIVRDA